MMISLPLAASASILLESFWLSDLFGKLIVLALVVFSILAWTIMLQKWLELRNIRADDERFTHAFKQQAHPLQLYVESQAHPGSRPFKDSVLWPAYVEACATAEREFKARIRHEGRSADAIDITSEKLTLTQIESIRHAAECGAADQALLVEESMAFLGSIYTVAPMLGLFGTVWGVMAAFYSMGLNGAANLSAMAPGMSSAMLTTFIGLVVAIPSAMGVNSLNARIRFVSIQLENFPELLAGALQRTYITD